MLRSRADASAAASAPAGAAAGSRWADRSRLVQAPLPSRGPDSWRRSALPR
ncbi:MAG TPA: hypothetical protein VKU39_08695 [Streptosporangiaceae bacterium]|nr:hypothetical protein [Streptosporangiaceae bacterium]